MFLRFKVELEEGNLAIVNRTFSKFRDEREESERESGRQDQEMRH